MTYIQGTPMGVQTLCVCVSAHAERVRVPLRLPSDAQLCVGSCVPPLSFSKKLVCSFGLQLFKFLRRPVSLSGEYKCPENVSPS